MPQVTVYIRNDDLPKWKAIEKKTEFIHDALNPIVPKGNSQTDTSKMVIKNSKDVHRALDAPKAPKVRETPDLNSEFISKSYSARKKK
jgi:hypothetical protein